MKKRMGYCPLAFEIQLIDADALEDCIWRWRGEWNVIGLNGIRRCWYEGERKIRRFRVRFVILDEKQRRRLRQTIEDANCLDMLVGDANVLGNR